MRTRHLLLTVTLMLFAPLVLGGQQTIAAPTAPTGGLRVCAACAYPTIEAALAAAGPGEEIAVLGGVYDGPLTLAKPVRLVGVGWPVLDGHDRGTVVRITAPDVTLRGFIVRNSGDNFDHEESAVAVEAPRAIISDNQLLNDLFGVNLRQAPDSRIERNTIVGKPVPEGVRGDGIKVWYSADTQIIGNRVDASRDCLVWYSNNTLVRDNTVTNGRYGFHMMNSNGNVIEHNRLENNSVGIYLMYGHDITVRDNLLRGSRGPSGQGLGVKEIDGVEIERNVIVDNRIGVYIDNSPLSFGVYNHLRGNLLAYNDSGLGLLPSDRNNVFSRNSFVDNLEQVTVLGGGRLGNNQWATDGVGNFWSDYTGYDADRNGIGDIPYRSDRLTEQLMDSQPILRLFRFSVGAVAVDFAARAFPAFRADPKLVDPAPLTTAVVPSNAPAALATTTSWPVALFATLSLLMVGGFVWWGRHGAGRTVSVARRSAIPPTGQADQRDDPPHVVTTDPLITLEAVTKRYGDTCALDTLSLTMRRGEALALWGPNGAGKTTLLRCLLGGTGYLGEIRVAGCSPARQGTAVRRLIGYVPQEMPTFDLTVGELTTLIARLRGVEPDVARERLTRFDLTGVEAQPVSSLSGGMKQKLALTLALLGDPPILVLDEPTANLDARTQAELLGLLLALKRQGRTLLFTSHRWYEVSLLADRVIHLERGRQVEGSRTAGELMLRVDLEAGSLDAAQTLLRQQGFAASRNGKAILVSIAPNRKAEPLVLLARSGYVITDFDLEQGTGG